MKHFSKSLLAVALLAASAGAANASIQVSNNTTSEAYLSVYDSTQGLTFTLDLGLTIGDLVLNKANDTFSKSYDLAALTAGSAGAKWSTFAANLNAATTVYGVVASGTAGKLFATSDTSSTPTKFATLAGATGAVSVLANHIATVNTAARADNGGLSMIDPTSLNLSAIISDADTANTGQHNQEGPFSTLNGGKSNAAADIAYGSIGNFVYYGGTALPFEAVQKWTLAGNTLTYAAVPLPAAVWMFGAGLMGVLGLTRRKNAAV